MYVFKGHESRQDPLNIICEVLIQLEQNVGEKLVHVEQFPKHPHVPLLNRYLLSGHYDTQNPLFQ